METQERLIVHVERRFREEQEGRRDAEARLRQAEDELNKAKETIRQLEDTVKSLQEWVFQKRHAPKVATAEPYHYRRRTVPLSAPYRTINGAEPYQPNRILNGAEPYQPYLPNRTINGAEPSAHGTVRFGWYGSVPFMVRFGAINGRFGSVVATLGGMSFLKYPLKPVKIILAVIKCWAAHDTEAELEDNTELDSDNDVNDQKITETDGDN
ncbi:hypothetical protein BpHYR1_027700 [Brachionus plicatilis]|uniref:Uncharacterized protein n=1 Tax=Brachionus plicatilis TaxID=10195 RepID=A0A3M7Q6R6_BRAPC|nr:hypothetical protein BpHYR1_027700 [Brachionus plicatilis]